MAVAELGEVVLDLERLVPQLVVDREWLEPERGVRRAALSDVDEREQRIGRRPRAAALILRRVPGLHGVGDTGAVRRVPFADARTDVLENLVVRVPERQEGVAGTGASEVRRGGG